MKINSELVKQLRADKQWSQDQLSEICGLNLRTVQRLETTGKGSMESVRALAAVFAVDPAQLILPDSNPTSESSTDTVAIAAITAIKTCFLKFDDFSGRSTRFEYWWFVVFITLLLAIATVIHPKAYQILSIVIFVPLIAVGTRRLRDSGQSPWLQLFGLIPFGVFLVFYYMTMETSAPPVEADI